MLFDSDDPRLTAYALGELDPAESAEIVRLLAEHEEASKLVEEIRRTASWITDGLKLEHERAATISLESHQLIEQTLQKKAFPSVNRPWWRRPAALSSIAAVLVGGVTIGWLSLSVVQVPRMARSPLPADVYAYAPAPSSEALAGLDSSRSEVALRRAVAVPRGSSPGRPGELATSGSDKTVAELQGVDAAKHGDAPANGQPRFGRTGPGNVSVFPPSSYRGMSGMMGRAGGMMGGMASSTARAAKPSRPVKTSWHFANNAAGRAVSVFMTRPRRRPLRSRRPYRKTETYHRPPHNPPRSRPPGRSPSNTRRCVVHA